MSKYKKTIDGRWMRRITHHTHKNEGIKRVYALTKSLLHAQAQGHHKSQLSTLRYLGDPTTNMDIKQENAKVWDE